MPKVPKRIRNLVGRFISYEIAAQNPVECCGDLPEYPDQPGWCSEAQFQNIGHHVCEHVTSNYRWVLLPEGTKFPCATPVENAFALRPRNDVWPGAMRFYRNNLGTFALVEMPPQE